MLVEGADSNPRKSLRNVVVRAEAEKENVDGGVEKEKRIQGE